MDITYYKVENDSIIKTDQVVKPADWSEKLNWINICVENRKDVTDYFQEVNLFKNLSQCIEKPEEHPFSNTFEKTIILNIAISKAANIYKTDYISVIIDNHLLITITTQTDDYFNESTLSAYTEKKFTSLSNFLFYVLAVKILAQSNANLSVARNRLQGIEHKLSNDPGKISPKELMSCERDISQLSDIIEDQYLGFEILDSFNSDNHRTEDIQQTSKITKGFEPLDKAILRLSTKAESLRLQYMLIQQEKSTRKINILTIVQAVFVPLTFITGVYGMNFINMPELNWKFGYLLVWFVFVFLAGGLLIYFYKKGWFDSY